jgi:hypothetical protein
MSLESILNLIAQFAGIDIAAQFATFADSFAYNILLWVLNLGGII